MTSKEKILEESDGLLTSEEIRSENFARPSFQSKIDSKKLSTMKIAFEQFYSYKKNLLSKW